MLPRRARRLITRSALMTTVNYLPPTVFEFIFDHSQQYPRRSLLQVFDLPGKRAIYNYVRHGLTGIISQSRPEHTDNDGPKISKLKL